jgi:rRNA biogenesis protein RRP5
MLFCVDLNSDSRFPHGKFVRVRVLKSIPGQSLVDVSKRSSRIEGDLDEDEAPEVGDMVNGYVVHTNKSGCFVRLARHVQGRVILKELCDGFLPDPVVSFPTGRLVVGKVKTVGKAQKKSKKATDPFKIQVDIDMRESTLLEDQNKLKFDDIEIGTKHKGTVTRVEQYGVFVRIESSDVSGLVHKSECSDNYIKNLEKLFDPGDLVKILVVKKETEEKRIGFSMKASHFEDDEDSDASSIGDSTSDEEGDRDMMDMDDDGLASDDENLVSKLAAKIRKGEDDSDSDDKSSSEDDSEGDSDSDDEEKAEKKTSRKDKKKLDTDVGFNWGPGRSAAAGKTKDDDNSSDDSDSASESDDDDADAKTSHKSKKKQALRRREEKEITRRETALADGTADENPETAADFERLIAGNPNSSEIWIRYMAFHLSLADIPSARAVADRAFGKIEFRQEKEKLNVWTALLTLEHKYGSEDSLQTTIDKACQHNNPKQVYLRVCEILEKDAEATSSPDAVAKADAMFTKMCKKFKSKKKAWVAHLQYLLKLSRHQEAHALLKRALMSLASYKHAETMTKFAQLEFEFGSAERARTVFDGILLKYPKRLDLFFVYLDKEVKFGKVEAARAMLEKKVDPSAGENKLSDKQMKSLFKKWYRIEEQHGDDETQGRVKDTARAYVQQGTK